MAVSTLLQLLLIVLAGNSARYLVKATNIRRQSVNADIISLEEYGITIIQQGFVIEIPSRKRRTELATAAVNLCKEVPKTIICTTQYYAHVCGILKNTIEWLMLTTNALERQHDKLIRDSLASLLSDDRHWVKPNRDNFNH